MGGIGEGSVIIRVRQMVSHIGPDGKWGKMSHLMRGSCRFEGRARWKPAPCVCSCNVCVCIMTFEEVLVLTSLYWYKKFLVYCYTYWQTVKFDNHWFYRNSKWLAGLCYWLFFISFLFSPTKSLVMRTQRLMNAFYCFKNWLLWAFALDVKFYNDLVLVSPASTKD